MLELRRQFEVARGTAPTNFHEKSEESAPASPRFIPHAILSGLSATQRTAEREANLQINPGSTRARAEIHQNHRPREERHLRCTAAAPEGFAWSTRGAICTPKPEGRTRGRCTTKREVKGRERSTTESSCNFQTLASSEHHRPSAVKTIRKLNHISRVQLFSNKNDDGLQFNSVQFDMRCQRRREVEMESNNAFI
jgi:hypothetical protein